MNVIEKIQEAAKKQTAELRFVRAMDLDQVARQGDIYLTKIEDVPEGAKEINEMQLAPGTTKGSRHVVHGARVFVLPESTDPLLGPIVTSKERFEVQHPEHANFSMPSGTYQVTYQRDYAREERARVMD